MCSGVEEDHPAPAKRHRLPERRPSRVTPRAIPRSSGRSSRTFPSPPRGRVPAPPHPSPAPPRPDRSGARRTPSCLRRGAAFVVIWPVGRLTAAVCLA